MEGGQGKVIYLQLFWEFFKTGLFSVGGGLATLPFLRQMGNAFGWFNEAELTNMLAVSESTPGPIGVNMATYVGTTVTNGNLTGGLVATFGLVLPSFLVILLIAGILKHFRENRFVDKCFKMIRPASVGLVAAAVLSVLKIALFRASEGSFLGIVPFIPAIVLFAVLALGRWKFQKLHPIVFIAVGAAAGILYKVCGGI